jgi:CHAT domain-containing protein
MTKAHSSLLRFGALIAAGLLVPPALLPAPAAAQAQPVDPDTISPGVRAPTTAEQAQLDQLTSAIETATAARKWDDAIASGRKALAIEEATFGPAHPEVAGTLTLIAGWLTNEDKFADAAPLYQRALGILEKSLGADHPLTSAAVDNLAANMVSRGRAADAQPLYLRALETDKRLYGDRDKRTASAYNNVGFNLARQGRYRDAKTYYDFALSIGRAAMPADDADFIPIQNNVAANLDALGRPLDAEPIYRDALAKRIAKLGTSDPAVAVSYNNLAFNLDLQGRYAEAAPAYTRALAIREQTDPQGARAATSYNNLARNLNVRAKLEKSPAQAKKLFDQADSFYHKAVTIWEKVYGKDSPVTAIGYSNIGVNLQDQGRLSEAQPWFERALAIRQAKLAATHPDLATGQIKLAQNLGLQKRYAQADPLYGKGLAARRALLGPSHPDLALGLTDYANMLSDMGQRPRALDTAREAANIVRTRRDARLSADLPTSGNAAVQALTRANAEDASRVDPLAGAFSALLRADWLRAAEASAERDTLRDEAFEAAQDLETSVAARTMAETAARTAAGSDALAKLTRQQQDLSAQARERDAQLLAALVDGDQALAQKLRSDIAATGSQLAAVDAQLRKSFPDYSELVSPGALAIAETQKRLHPDEGVLMIALSGDDVYSFAISADAVAWNRVEHGGKPLLDAVGRLRCQVDPQTCSVAEGPERDKLLTRGAAAGSTFTKNGYRAYDVAASYQIYHDIVQPVESAFTGKKKLLVVTSGTLSNLPLGLLVTTPLPGKDGSDPDVLAQAPWFADRYALTSLPAVSVLRALRRPGKMMGGGPALFVGYGAPVLQGPQARPATMDFIAPPVFRSVDGVTLADPSMLRTLDPLPGTVLELRGMAQTLKANDQTLHLGPQATETSLRHDPQLSRARILAFATHSILPEELSGIAEPGLVLTPPTTPTPDDDGLLTASEVSRLSLSAEWVILSACNTASADGTQSPDGLSDLARAFLYSGAGALLASHWRVQDDPTAALTVETLRLVRSGANLSRAAALQQSMLSVRTGKRADGSAMPNWDKSWAHPGAWGPFTVISNGD